MECGSRLERLPMNDMLDVVHYFFETDALGEKEVIDAKRDMRRGIYRELYKRSYTWGEETVSEDSWGTKVSASGAAVGVGEPVMTHKPYVPPTPMNPNAPNPFGSVLDAPLG